MSTLTCRTSSLLRTTTTTCSRFLEMARPRRRSAHRRCARRTGSRAAEPSTSSGASTVGATVRGRPRVRLGIAPLARTGTRAAPASCTCSRMISCRPSPTAACPTARARTADPVKTAMPGPERRCSCNSSEARETGRHFEHGQHVFEYTCCMSGDNVGEECGDCCVDYESILIAIIGGVVRRGLLPCLLRHRHLLRREGKWPRRTLQSWPRRGSRRRRDGAASTPAADGRAQPAERQIRLLFDQHSSAGAASISVTQPQVLTPQVLQPQGVTQPAGAAAASADAASADADSVQSL